MCGHVQGGVHNYRITNVNCGCQFILYANLCKLSIQCKKFNECIFVTLNREFTHIGIQNELATTIKDINYSLYCVFFTSQYFM